MKRVFSEEHKRKLSESHKGQIPTNLEQLRQLATGRIPSKESLRKRSESQKGKPKNISEAGRARMRIKNYPVWNKGLKGYMAGEKNGRWIADRSLLKKYNRQVGPVYAEWREKCKVRDKKKCRMGNKDCKGRLEVHHILRFVDFPELRYEVSNGITLCHFHHPRKKLEEKKLIELFRELLSQIEQQL